MPPRIWRAFTPFAFKMPIACAFCASNITVAGAGSDTSTYSRTVGAPVVLHLAGSISAILMVALVAAISTPTKLAPLSISITTFAAPLAAVHFAVVEPLVAALP